MVAENRASYERLVETASCPSLPSSGASRSFFIITDLIRVHIKSPCIIPAMGIMAVSAGSSKFLSDWRNSSYSTGNTSRGELPWAGLILLIGIQLLLYSE